MARWGEVKVQGRRACGWSVRDGGAGKNVPVAETLAQAETMSNGQWAPGESVCGRGLLGSKGLDCWTGKRKQRGQGAVQV